MLDVYIGIGVFVLIYLCYLLFIALNKKKLKKYIDKSREVQIIRRKYNLNLDKVNHKLVANIFGLNDNGTGRAMTSLDYKKEKLQREIEDLRLEL